MSSTTSRVSLYKPAGGEDINVTTDLNNNYDKIDTNLNFRVVANAAARNAISPFWAGLNVRETDTGKLYVSNGSAPISASWKEIPVADSTFGSDLDLAAGKQVNVGGAATSATFAANNAATGDDFLSSRITTDSQSRFLVDTDGKMWWGPGGASTQDTNLYRSTGSTLKTDDNLEVAQDLLVTGDTQINGDLRLDAGQTVYRNTLSAQTIVANTTTETVVANLTIPASDMVAGAVYKITAMGVASCTGTPSITFRGKYGGTGGSQFAQSGAITFATSGATNKCWNVEIWLVCVTAGASGSVAGRMATNENISATGTNPSSLPVQRLDGTGTNVADTTTSKDLILSVQWSAASASNTLTSQIVLLERVA